MNQDNDRVEPLQIHLKVGDRTECGVPRGPSGIVWSGLVDDVTCVFCLRRIVEKDIRELEQKPREARRETMAATYAVPLPNGKQIVLSGDWPLTPPEFAAFVAVLQAMSPGLIDPPAAVDPLRESLARLGMYGRKTEGPVR